MCGGGGDARAHAGERACGRGPEQSRDRARECAHPQDECNYGAGWGSRLCDWTPGHGERARDRGLNRARGHESGRGRACGHCLVCDRVCGDDRCLRGGLLDDESGPWCGRGCGRVGSVHCLHCRFHHFQEHVCESHCGCGQLHHPTGAVPSLSQRPVEHKHKINILYVVWWIILRMT